MIHTLDAIFSANFDGRLLISFIVFETISESDINWEIFPVGFSVGGRIKVIASSQTDLNPLTQTHPYLNEN